MEDDIAEYFGYKSVDIFDELKIISFDNNTENIKYFIVEDSYDGMDFHYIEKWFGRFKGDNNGINTDIIYTGEDMLNILDIKIDDLKEWVDNSTNVENDIEDFIAIMPKSKEARHLKKLMIKIRRMK